MAESKLEGNEVKETKKRGRPKKEEGTNNEKLKKETKKNTKASNEVKIKSTITEGKGKTIEKKTATKKKSTSTKKAVSKIEEETKTSKAKTATKTTAKKETMPKKTTKTAKTAKKKIEEPEVVLKEEKKEKELVVKKDISIDDEKLEKIQKEINKQTKLSKDEKKKINRKIFQNIVMAIGIVVYFIFINLGFNNIEESTYLTDLKVFGAVAIGITIILFEKAYKKDSGELTIYGIEMLIIAICTLLTNYIYKFHYSKYMYIITSIAMLFAVYYVGKSIVIYVKMKNKALKKASDIHKIVRK